MSVVTEWDHFIRAHVTLAGMLASLLPLFLLARRGDADAANLIREIVEDLISRKLSPERIS